MEHAATVGRPAYPHNSALAPRASTYADYSLCSLGRRFVQNSRSAERHSHRPTHPGSSLSAAWSPKCVFGPLTVLRFDRSGSLSRFDRSRFARSSPFFLNGANLFDLLHVLFLKRGKSMRFTLLLFFEMGQIPDSKIFST